MKQTIFPEEIIRFSLERHYSRFSKYSVTIYFLLILIIRTTLAALPIIKVDATTQSRGIIRSKTESGSIQTPVPGQVKRISIHENRKVFVGNTLIWLAPEMIDNQIQMPKYKIELYFIRLSSHYVNNLYGLVFITIKKNLC